MKEDVIAANLANLRQSVNELKETVNKLNVGSQNHEQTAQSPVDERTVYNSVAKSFCTCWNDALSVVKSLSGETLRSMCRSQCGCQK